MARSRWTSEALGWKASLNSKNDLNLKDAPQNEKALGGSRGQGVLPREGAVNECPLTIPSLKA